MLERESREFVMELLVAHQARLNKIVPVSAARRVFFLAQENQYDARTPQLLETNQKHWFWGTLAMSWRIYRDVLFASFLLGVFGLAMPLFIMNVYDRVVPNQAIDTLCVFTIVVLGISVLEFIIRSLRVYFLD